MCNIVKGCENAKEKNQIKMFLWDDMIITIVKN